MDNYTTSSHVIRNYRQRAKNSGYNVDQYTDQEILRFLGDDLRNKGRTHEDIATEYGQDFSSAYLDDINAPERGREGVIGGIKEFGAGFERAADGVLGTASAVGGLAADFYGLEGASDALMDKSAQFRAQAAQGAPSIERATDVRWGNMDEVARFLAGGLGEATPSVIEAGASFAAGGGAGYLIAKQLAKKRLREVAKNVSKDNLDEVFKQAIAATQAGQMGKRVGSNIALGADSFGMNTGEIYSELYSFSQLDKDDPDYIPEEQAKGLAVSHGLLAGGLDFASAGAMLNKVLNIGDKPAASYLKRVVQGLPAGVFVEGATEAAQQFISMSAEKYAHGDEDPFSQDEINGMIDAGVLGALGGTQFTAMGAIKGPKKKTEDVDVDSEEVAGDPEKATEGIDKRLESLNERLKLDGTNLEVGMEVEQFLGISGTVSAIRSDGMIEVTPAEGGDPLVIREDTLSQKLKPIAELEAQLEEIKERADKGDPSAQFEEAQINNQIDEQTQETDTSASGTPLPKSSPPKRLPNTKFTPEKKEAPKGPQLAIFTKGQNDVVGLTKQELSDVEEVYDTLQSLAKSGKIRRTNSNHQQVLMAGGMTEETHRKFKNKTIRKYLIQAGVINVNGGWTGETKQDTDTEETNRLQKINDREDIIVNQLKVGIGDSVRIGNSEPSVIYGFTDDNKVLFEDGGIGVEPKKLKLAKPKKPKPAPIQIKPSEEQYRQAHDEVHTERGADSLSLAADGGTIDERMAFDAETEELIDIRAQELLQAEQKETKLKEAEKVDESKSNDELIKEVEDKTEKKPKKKVLPSGSLSNKFVGDFDISEGVSDSLGSDGSLMGNWEGLSDRDKSSTKMVGTGKKKKQVKTPGNRVLIVVEKINNDHDDVESGQIRVLSAKKGIVDGGGGNKGREVLKVYDSLRVGAKGKSPGWRTLYGKGKRGTIDETPLPGYRLIGKITTSRDAIEYGADKTDAIFEDIESLKEHRAFKTSMLMSSNRTQLGKFRDAERAVAFLNDEGKQIVENYKKELGNKLGTAYLTPEGKAIDVSGQSAPTYVSSKEALDYFVDKASNDPNAIDAYVKAFSAFATSGMDKAVDAIASKEQVYDKTFAHDGKQHSILEVLNRARGKEGYEPFDTDAPFETSIVKAALAAASRLGSPTTLSGGGTFFDAGKTAGQIAQDLESESDEELLDESLGQSDIRSGESEFDEVGGSRDTDVDTTRQLDITSGSSDLSGSMQFHKVFGNPRDLTIAIGSVANPIRDEIIALSSVDLANTQDAAERLGLDSGASKGAVQAAFDNKVEYILKEMYIDLVQKELVPKYYKKDKETGKQIRESELYDSRINSKQNNIRSNFLKNIKFLEETLNAKEMPIKVKPVPVVRAKIRKRLDIDNINKSRDSSLGVTNFLHREFGLDLRDALYHGGFTQEETQVIIDRLESAEVFKEPRNNGRKYPVSDAIYKDKQNGARVKSDGNPYKNGFLETAAAKNLIKYIDETFARIEEAVISKDDSEKWSRVTQFLKDSWIPVSYEMEIDSDEVQEKPVVFDEDTKEGMRQKLIDDLNSENRKIVRLRTQIDNLRNTGKRGSKVFKGKSLPSYSAAPRKSRDGKDKPSAREIEVNKDLGALKLAEEKKEAIAEKLNKLIEVPNEAPKQKEFDTVVEDGMLLSEFAQTMSEYFGFTDELNFLNDEHYNSLSGQIEVLTQDVVSTLDKRIKHTSLISPTTGRVEPSMPLVVNESTAAQADKIAREKTSIATRSPENPLEKTGMDKQLADNRLAIAKFLDGGQADQPFSLIAGMDRLLDIVESNPDFREAEALAFIARKLKGSKLAEGVKIRFVPWEVYSKVASVNEYGYSAAQYMPGKNEIWVSDVFGDGTGSSMENLVSTIAHEAIHVPTKQFLDVGYAYFTNNPLAKELLEDSSMGEEFGKIYGQIHETLLPMLRKLGGADMIYGLSSADEFLSELGSDYQLRNFLRGVKLSNEDRKALGIQGKSAIRTAWDFAVNLLAKLLGISDRIDQNPELLKHTEKMLNKVVGMADNLAYMGRGINDVNVRGISSLDIFAGPKRQMIDKTMEKSSEFTWIDGTQRKHILDRDMKINQKADARFINMNKEMKGAFDRGLIKEGDAISVDATKKYSLQFTDGMKLDELIDHPALFEAYPQLREVQIREDNSGAFGSWEGYWDQKKNKWTKGKGQASRRIPTITLSRSTANRVASTLIHEIQHAVDEIEGFPKGSNTSVSNKIMTYIVEALAERETGGQKFRGKDVLKFVSRLDEMIERADDDLQSATSDESDRYNIFMLHRTLSTIRTALMSAMGSIEMSDVYTSAGLVANAIVETDSGANYDMSEILYFWNFGEITARTQEKLLNTDTGQITSINASGEISSDRIKQSKDNGNEKHDETHYDTEYLRRKNLRKIEEQIGDKFEPGASWSLPTSQWLRDYATRLPPRDIKSQDKDFIYTLASLADIFSSNTSQSLPNKSNGQSIPKPDESARVYHEAAAGGLNELVVGLGQAFKSVRDSLPTDMNMEQFIDKFGKLSLGWGSQNVTTAMKAVGKNLAPFEINATDVRITDAGRNRTAKHYGIRYAIAYLEKTREHSRKVIRELTTNLKRSQVEVAASKTLLKALETRQLESLDTLSNALRNKIVTEANSAGDVSSSTFQRLEKYIENLPETELTQKDLKDMKGLTSQQVGDVMVALVEQPGVIEERSAEEINQLIATGLIPGLGALQGNDKQTTLRRTAFVHALKNSGDIMSLLRLARNKLGVEQKEFIDAGEKILKATTVKEVESVSNNFNKRVGTMLKHIKAAKIKILELEESAKGIEKDVKVNNAINETLKWRSDKFRWTMGELEDFDIRNGSKIRVMVKNKEGKFDKKSYQVYEVKFKNGEIEDREGFIKANRQTLEWIRHNGVKYRNEPWLDIMREQAELSLLLPVTQQWSAVRRAAWMAGLESLNQRFSRLGYEGKRLAQMTTRTTALYRDLISQSMKYSKEFNRAFDNVLKATGETGTSLYTGMYQDIFYWFDNHPEHAGNEELAFSEMWKEMRKTANVKDRSRLNDEARRAVKVMVQKTIQARDWEAKVNRDLGNRVKDEEVKVQSYIDGDKKNVDFYRMPLDMGYATLPRAINDAKVNSLMEYMKELGWSGSRKDMKADELIVALHQNGEVDELGIEIESLFDEQVVNRFLNPFMNGMNRKSLFYGPADKTGWGQEMSNAYISEVWRKSNGSMLVFMDAIYEASANKEIADTQKRGDWYISMYKQIHKRYQEINRVHRDLMHRADSETRDSKAMKHVPRSLDARQVESRLPKEFFLYDMYDEVSTPIRLAMFSAASVFGRDGGKATEAFRGGRGELLKSYDKFATIISEVTGVKPDKPSARYSRKVKKAAYKALEDMGSKKPREEFQKLYNDSVAYGELMTTFSHLKDYYGANNDAGPFKDARFLLEMLGTQSLSVLNNPKSSFWQGMSMFEFPLAFRGANKMAAKGTAKALSNFANQTFGGIAEALGIQLDRVGRYASSLNSTHFNMEEMELGLRDYLTQIGQGGEMQDPKNMKRYLRMIKGIATHHKKRGTRAPIDLMSAVTGIFPYINNVVNHSVGVGAAYVYQDLVLKVAKHIKDNGLNTFQEFTAEELGMGSSSFEWIVGEKDGFNNANHMLIDSGAPSISRMAFDYVDRMKSNSKTPVMSHDQILMVNQMAMNNMSGEGFNSKPAWLYTNPMMKYFSFFLGWPLGKMARDNKFIFRGDQDSVNSYAAFLKYIGLMSAIYLPVGLSFAFMIDWYDEEVLDKPNSLPPLTPWALLPVVGPAIAATDEQFTLYALTSRMAKAGTPYGMGFDVMNSLMAKGDTYGGTKEFSLDSRIFAFSIFKNIYDSMGNWMHQGEFDWGNVGRPLTYAFGGNSVLQAFDATNTFFDVDNFESRVSEYIGVRNYVKKTAFLMGMEMRAPGGSGSFARPSPVSVNIKQMERAAYAGDQKDFDKQYGEAIEAARQYLLDNPRVGVSPEKYIMQKFKARSLRAGITRAKIGDADWGALLDTLPEDARNKIKRYEANHEYFLLGMEESDVKSSFKQYGTAKERSDEMRRRILLGY